MAMGSVMMALAAMMMAFVPVMISVVDPDSDCVVRYPHHIAGSGSASRTCRSGSWQSYL
jgi:hypothetical protein